MPLSEAELRRYSRHLSLPEIGVAGQEKLQAARVLVIGAGGLGSPAALYLAAGGIGKLGLLDFDRVDVSNLQRQVLYDTAEYRRCPRPNWRARGSRRSTRSCNLQCASDRAVRRQRAARCSTTTTWSSTAATASRRATWSTTPACIYGKALVSAAIHRFEGQAMTYVPGRGPCYRCLFPQAAEGVVANCAEAGVLGVLPGVLGALQATEAIKLIIGVGEPLIGRLLTYDALELRFQEFRFARRADCAVCGEHPSITAPQDPPGFCTVDELRRVRSISAAQLAAAHQGHRTLPISLIDVREPAEFAAAHLPRAINIPLGTIEQDRWQLPHAGTLVFMCRSGVRSLRACALAQPHGRDRSRGSSRAALRPGKPTIDPSLRLCVSASAGVFRLQSRCTAGRAQMPRHPRHRSSPTSTSADSRRPRAYRNASPWRTWHRRRPHSCRRTPH